MHYFAGCSGRSDAGCRTQDPVPFIGSSRIAARPTGDPAGVVATVKGRREIDLLFDSLGGAVGRVPVDATAFCHRDALACVQVYASAANDPARARREVTEVQAELGRLAGSGAYINYLDPSKPIGRRPRTARTCHGCASSAGATTRTGSSVSPSRSQRDAGRQGSMTGSRARSHSRARMMLSAGLSVARRCKSVMPAAMA
jgi:hypothetical protein